MPEYHLWDQEDVLPKLHRLKTELGTCVKIVDMIESTPTSFPVDIGNMLQYGMFNCLKQFIDIYNAVQAQSEAGSVITMEQALESFRKLVEKEINDAKNKASR